MLACEEQNAYLCSDIFNHKTTMKQRLITTSIFAAALSFLPTGQGLQARTATVSVDISQPRCSIFPTMWGIFLEDINFAADGGLYAEMVSNRSFDYKLPTQDWQAIGNVNVCDDGPFPHNPHYLRMDYSGHPKRPTALRNAGYLSGMSFTEGADYVFSVWARCPWAASQSDTALLRVELIDPALTQGTDRQDFASKVIAVTGADWQRYEITLRSGRTVDHGALQLLLYSPKRDIQPRGIDVEHVSLFPADTWKGRPGGLRRDLVEALADLHPGVFRFPGGCVVEGTELATRYDWKKTVGPVEDRPTQENRWQFASGRRWFPQYYQSFGLGFYEYFLLCEDLGCEALPVVSCGLACQFENATTDAHAHANGEELQQYIQDAADLIDFANADTTNQWGRLRAQMGHPAPFRLKLLAIGNEQWDDGDSLLYTSRLGAFLETLRRLHPEVRYIGTSGPGPEGKRHEIMQRRMHELGVDLYDEHFYRNDEWMLSQSHRYDSYSRQGPKVFAGEYACHVKGKKYNLYQAALCEAAFMTGMERNSDVVEMATYAPLLAHAEGWQWRPDLIWFDNRRVVRTCSYMVQQLYGQYTGDEELNVSGPVETIDSLYVCASRHSQRGELYIKMVNVADEPCAVNLELKGRRRDYAKWHPSRLVTLQSNELEAENTINDPNRVQLKEVPMESALPDSVMLPPRSVNVLILSTKHLQKNN